MIKSFKHKNLRRHWHDKKGVGLPANKITRINDILDALDAATRPEDLDVPGYFFHELTNNRKGTFSMRVTVNWRITFRFEGTDVIDVNFEDYH